MKTGSGLTPLHHDRTQVDVRGDQADVPVAFEHPHRAVRHALHHVSGLGHRGHEMILVRCEKQRGGAERGETGADVIVPEELEAAYISLTRRAGGELDESLDLTMVGVTRVQAKSRQPTRKLHCPPGQGLESMDRQAEAALRLEIGKRVEDDEGADALRAHEGKAQGECSPERLADHDGLPILRGRLVDDLPQVLDEHVHAPGVISQGIGGDAPRGCQERGLTIE